MARFAAVTPSDFTMTAHHPDGTPAVEIVARLQAVNAVHGTREFEQFALLFVGPSQPLLPQGNYLFTHPGLGTLPLFTVPVGQDARGTQYEVCISRRLPQPG